MPAISLIVCVHRQRDFLERLIRESAGCYDELIVLHDIPDVQKVREVTEAAGGRFFERPPAFLQEPHWPFAWTQARHDWILRFDTDEFPSEELKKWLREFRQAPEPAADFSGFTCIWPMWDGRRMVTKRWPAGRLFLFNKHQVRFFGMCEQSPVPDGRCQSLDLILNHQPGRKSYGLGNILFRGQSRRGAMHIAKCLLGKPTDLICWRWEDDAWPRHWDEIRRRPLLTAVKRLIRGSLSSLRDQWRADGKIIPGAALGGPLHQVMICLKYYTLQKSSKSNQPD